MRCTVSLAAMLLVIAVAGNATAEPSRSSNFDLGHWLDQGLRFIVRTSVSATPSLSELEAMFPSTDPTLRDEVVRTGTLGFAHAVSMGTGLGLDKGHWYDEKPGKNPLQPALRFSLVARDWKGAYSILGHSVPTDQIRITRSSRMLVGRISVGDGPIVPFFHVGAGEWRYDPDMLPSSTPRDQEFAMQFSGGMELRLSKEAAFALETDYVLLCRERREPQNVPTPHIIGSFGVFQMTY